MTEVEEKTEIEILLEKKLEAMQKIADNLCLKHILENDEEENNE